MYSAFKEFYNLLSQVDSVYHDAALKLGLTEKGEELMKNTAHRLIAIENAIFESWSPEEQQLFMKLNRDFAAKFTEKTKAL